MTGILHHHSFYSFQRQSHRKWQIHPSDYCLSVLSSSITTGETSTVLSYYVSSQPLSNLFGRRAPRYSITPVMVFTPDPSSWTLFRRQCNQSEGWRKKLNRPFMNVPHSQPYQVDNPVESCVVPLVRNLFISKLVRTLITLTPHLLRESPILSPWVNCDFLIPLKFTSILKLFTHLPKIHYPRSKEWQSLFSMVIHWKNSPSFDLIRGTTT